MYKRKALLLTEGYHGMISQVEGMAKALKVQFQHKIVRLNWLWNFIPPKFTPKSDIILKDKNYINDFENFNLIISCGRKSVIPSIILKKKNKKILTIHIQDPKINFNNFDLVIAPEHDNIKGDNVISSRGAIHYITQEEIKKYESYLIEKAQGKKVVTLVLGGPNKYYSFNERELIQIFNKIKESFIQTGYMAIIIPSMRTPKKIIEIASREFSDNAHVVNSVNRQAYLSSLALAKYIVVTCDSTSMISEAAMSGKPIFVAQMKPKRNNYRFERFFALFRELGITKDLGEKIEDWSYSNFNEAERIASMIHSKFNI